MADSLFSIDAANQFANKTGSVPAVSVNTTPTQPVPVAAPVPVVSGQPAKPTADVPEGAAPVAAGMAPGQTVPTVAQARAGVPIVVQPTLPPQQQGATPPAPTLAQRAMDVSSRVAQGFSNLFGAAQPAAKQPSPEFLATEARFSAPPPAPAAAPNLFAVRKAIARNY